MGTMAEENEDRKRTERNINPRKGLKHAYLEKLQKFTYIAEFKFQNKKPHLYLNSATRNGGRYTWPEPSRYKLSAEGLGLGVDA